MDVPDVTRTRWRTSSRSSGNGACVEVAEFGTAIAVRDSRDRDGTVLVFALDEWREFAAGVSAGEFDLG